MCIKYRSVIWILWMVLSSGTSQTVCDGGDLWPSTPSGTTATISCNELYSVNYYSGSATRECIQGQWGEVSENCVYLAPWDLSYPDGMIYRTNYRLSLTPVYSGYVSHWSIQPPLPSFLQLDSDTGVISGLLEESFELVFTVTAANRDQSCSVTVVISVLDSECPASGSWPSTDAMTTIYLPCPYEDRYIGNISRTCEGYARPQWGDVKESCTLGPPYALTYPFAVYNAYTGFEANGMVPSYRGRGDRFSVSLPLPGGLKLDDVTGAITGIAEGEEYCKKVTVTVENSAGACSTDVEICVVKSMLTEVWDPSGEPREKTWMLLSGAVAVVAVVLSSLLCCCRCCVRKCRKE